MPNFLDGKGVDMNNISKGALTAIAIGVLVSLGVLTGQNNTSEVPAQTEEVQAEAVQQQAEISANGRAVGYAGVSGETALKTLRNLVEVEVETSEFGEFVTSINGLAANSDSEYWAFYVNGEPATTGAGSYQSEEGDEIQWRLEAF